jgi:hypothetical protein
VITSLQLVYDYLLLSVPPKNSVESERAFSLSAAGVVCSKLRTRLVMKHWIICVHVAHFLSALSCVRAVELNMSEMTLYAI